MKKILLIALPPLLAVLVLIGVTYILPAQSSKGALQVTSIPKSQVFLDNKPLGQTPFCKCDPSDMLPVGDYTIRVVPTDTTLQPFEEKIKINKSILTVVDRTFGPTGESEGSIITLNELPKKEDTQILILTFPSSAQVFVDSNLKGLSPLLLKNIPASDHQIKVVRSGYKEKDVRIRTVQGYQLQTTVFLGIDANQASLTPTPSAVASPSATPASAQVTILQTPTGFLRVRATPSVTGAEVGRVLPGESHELINDQEDWYEIKLPNGTLGWISSQYARKQ